MDEAELSVSDESNYKHKLDVLQQQQELIEDEEKQEQEYLQEEQEARKEKKEAEEIAKREHVDASKVSAEPTGTSEPAVEEQPSPDDARMTKEQLVELAEALSVLTAKSSIVKERDELKALLEDNLLSEAVSLAT